MTIQLTLAETYGGPSAVLVNWDQVQYAVPLTTAQAKTRLCFGSVSPGWLEVRETLEEIADAVVALKKRAQEPDR
jgi:hypothetical protein